MTDRVDDILYGATDARQSAPAASVPPPQLLSDNELEQLRSRLTTRNTTEIRHDSLEAVLIAAGNASAAGEAGESSEYANLGELIRAQDDSLRPKDDLALNIYTSGRWILEELDLLETGKSKDGSTGFKITPKGKEFLERVTEPMWEWMGMQTYDSHGRRVRPRKSPRQ